MKMNVQVIAVANIQSLSFQVRLADLVIFVLSNIDAKITFKFGKIVTWISVVLLLCGCLSLIPFIEFRIWNNSSSPDVLNV